MYRKHPGSNLLMPFIRGSRPTGALEEAMGPGKSSGGEIEFDAATSTAGAIRL